MDARALSTELARLGELPEDAGSIELMATMTAQTPPDTFAQSEQNLFCVVLAVPAGPAEPVPMPLEDRSSDAERRRSLEIAISSAGARAEWLLDGTLLVTVRSLQSALDQVTLAARMALLVREHWPEAHVGVGTGRGTVQGFMPVGEAVERAARLLRAGMRAPDGELDDEPDPRRRLGVYVDELSARLLERRFALTVHAGCAFLTGEELSADETHLLLGKATPCVGREVELTTLLAILNGCIDESESTVALVTAAAGAGKSRLRHEFLRRVQTQQAGVTTLLGLGDMMSAGAPYGILGKALRRLCGLRGSELLDVQRQRFAARIGQHLSSADRPRAVAYLGELCGLAFPDVEHEKLRTARQEPRIMQEQISAAFITWLGAECAQAPVLLIIEDLHWGDPMTANLLDGALQALKQQPLMVLALARPEVHQLLPGLWSRHVPKEFLLPPLGRKACERLIHQVLGAKLAAPIVARLCAQSEGNALFLEEPTPTFHKAQQLRGVPSVGLVSSWRAQPRFEGHLHRVSGAQMVHALRCGLLGKAFGRDRRAERATAEHRLSAV